MNREEFAENLLEMPGGVYKKKTNIGEVKITIMDKTSPQADKIRNHCTVADIEINGNPYCSYKDEVSQDGWCNDFEEILYFNQDGEQYKMYGDGQNFYKLEVINKKDRKISVFEDKMYVENTKNGFDCEIKIVRENLIIDCWYYVFNYNLLNNQITLSKIKNDVDNSEKQIINFILELLKDTSKLPNLKSIEKAIQNLIPSSPFSDTKSIHTEYFLSIYNIVLESIQYYHKYYEKFIELGENRDYETTFKIIEQVAQEALKTTQKKKEQYQNYKMLKIKKNLIK